MENIYKPHILYKDSLINVVTNDGVWVGTLDGYCGSKAREWIETPLKTQLAEAQAECEEQARLNGMGSEREARLMAQLADAQAQLAAIKEKADFMGCFTGLTDCVGNRVYFGDTLDFDPTEWGEPFQFTVEYDPQDLFRANDIKSWCTKIQATRQPTQDKGE